MQDLSVTELRSIAKNRGIKEYNKLDKDVLLKNTLLQKKTLRILVEYYYKYNLFSLK